MRHLKIIKLMRSKLPADDENPELNELRQLQDKNKLLREQLARHQAKKVEEEKLEIARMKKLIESENERLVLEMSGDTGGAKSRLGATHSQVSRSVPRGTPAQSGQSAPASVSWHASYQQHLTKNQIKAAQATTFDPPVYQGLDMNGIRKIPHLRENVENLVEQVQGKVPSLDRRPSAHLSNLATKPTFMLCADLWACSQVRSVPNETEGVVCRLLS